MSEFEILFQVLMIILMILIVILALVYLGQQAWILEGLKNQCIAECVEINKLNPAVSCVC